MAATEKIKTAFERNAAAIAHSRSLGRKTGISKTTVRNGLTCDVQEGDWKFSVDMPDAVGGNGTAPTPGVYGRAALGSCLAICYMMYAAKMGVPINSLEVEVQADFDHAVLFNVTDEVPAGYLEVRYTITVDSDAPEETILKMLDEGDVHSPYLDIFARGQKCVRKVNIVAGEKS